ncbi:MAG TPA: hypothetical protein VHU83_13310 [Bryobacteraceae bacterium]|nr:hypothetical protein [Bryobacteraceae bacterium]
MRFGVALLVAPWLAGALLAQQSSQVPPTAPPEDQGPSANPITTLASQFFEHDFFNFYLFANGVYDSVPTNINDRSVNEGGLGFDGGGGADAFKQFKDGYLSLAYRGDYRDYSSTFFPSGTDQSLSFAYAKRLSRRWSFNFDVNGGIFLYGGTFFGAQPSQVDYVQTNPFSSESKFLSSGVALSYRQTRRLSYVFNGQYYLNRYNIPGSIGATGVTGAGSILYRLTARTTVGGTYSHTYFTYQRGAGQAQADTLVGNVSHTFHAHWFASLSGGFTRTDSSGTIFVPVLIIDGNNLLPGYEIGRYNRVSTFPSVIGSVSRQLRRSSISVSGGQNIASGNGVFLASKNLFVNGYYSYSTRRANLSFGGGVSHLTSVANTVSYRYTTTSFTASYAYNLMRHLGANLRYDYVKYGTIGSVSSLTDNRLLFGIYFSSKSVPLTLF